MAEYLNLCTEISFPEGPAFDQQGQLWLVDKDGESIIRISKDNKQIIHTGGHPNGIAINMEGQVIFCDSGYNSIRCYDPESRELTTLCRKLDAAVLKMPNDLAIDTLQQIIFTCPGDRLDDPEGYICVYNNKSKLYKLTERLCYPNGLALSLDGKYLYVAETGKRRIWKGAWDAENGNWIQPKPWAATAGPVSGGPDGIAIDEKGWVYAAIYGSGLVQAFNNDGILEKQWQLPGHYPTNLAFTPGRPGAQSGLVVTEVETGSVLMIPLERKGILC